MGSAPKGNLRKPEGFKILWVQNLRLTVQSLFLGGACTRRDSHPLPLPSPPPPSFSQVLGSSSYRGPLLFLVGGSAITVLLAAWARGSALRVLSPYTFTATFPIGKAEVRLPSLKLGPDSPTPPPPLCSPSPPPPSPLSAHLSPGPGCWCAPAPEGCAGGYCQGRLGYMRLPPVVFSLPKQYMSCAERKVDMSFPLCLLVGIAPCPLPRCRLVK